MLMYEVCWIHALAPNWAEEVLIPRLGAIDHDERDAAWAGFLSGAGKLTPKLFCLIKSELLLRVKESSGADLTNTHHLASLVLSGWLNVDNDCKRLVTSDEFRCALLCGSNAFRSHVLWQLARSIERDAGDTSLEDAQHLFREVWPKQKEVRNGSITSRMCELLFSTPECLATLTELLLPFLTKVTVDDRLHLYFRGKSENIVTKQGKKLLLVFHRILGSDVTAWPYDAGDTLEKIADSDSTICLDRKYQELMLKWNSR
jgi:hypothetical protein